MTRVPIFAQVLFLGSLQAHCVKQPVGGGMVLHSAPPTSGFLKS